MFCPKCGTENDNDATRCTACGEALEPMPAGVPVPARNIPTYLPQAIILTLAPLLLCCCISCFGFPAIPCGIVAIVYANQVGNKQACGDIAGALAASKNARQWCWVAFGIIMAALAVSMIVLVIQIIAGGFEAAMESHKPGLRKPW